MKTQRLTLASIILVALLSLAACGGTSPEPTPTVAVTARTVLKISGSATTTWLMTALKPAFEADTPGYQLETLSGSGTGGGVEGILQGVLDVAAMGRVPKEEEASQIDFVPLGFGPETPIAHPSVGIKSLSSEELISIFTGEVTNWSQVGGPDLAIIVYARAEDSAHTAAVRKQIFGDTAFGQDVQVMGGLGDMVSAVEGTPGSVGYANWVAVNSGGSNVVLIAVDGVGPDDPAYAGTIALGIGYLPDRQGDVQPLIDWLQSERGQAGLREFGVLPGQ